MDDIIKMLPVAFCFMGAHSASVFALSAGAVSFGQIVKSAEPAFAAVLSQFVYKKNISKAKWLCLPIVIGGVILASVKELDFAMSALVSACIANLFAAFKGNENKKLMETEGLKDRMGSVGNQFALTSILGFLMAVPVALLKEGNKIGEFVEMYKTNPILSFNLIASGLWFYGYNELATMTLKKTNAVTQSVANTAKRVIVIVGVAIVLGESLDPIKLLGCGIGIGGVLLYSVIDEILAAKKRNLMTTAYQCVVITHFTGHILNKCDAYPMLTSFVPSILCTLKEFHPDNGLNDKYIYAHRIVTPCECITMLRECSLLLFGFFQDRKS